MTRGAATLLLAAALALPAALVLAPGEGRAQPLTARPSTAQLDALRHSNFIAPTAAALPCPAAQTCRIVNVPPGLRVNFVPATYWRPPGAVPGPLPPANPNLGPCPDLTKAVIVNVPPPAVRPPPYPP